MVLSMVELAALEVHVHPEARSSGKLVERRDASMRPTVSPGSFTQFSALLVPLDEGVGRGEPVSVNRNNPVSILWRDVEWLPAGRTRGSPRRSNFALHAVQRLTCSHERR